MYELVERKRVQYTTIHHANVYTKNKSWEGAQRTKDTCNEIYEKSATATEAVKESVHKANEYVYQKGVDGTNVIKDRNQIE